MRASLSRLAVVAAAGAIAWSGCGAGAKTSAGADQRGALSHDERRAAERVREFLSAMHDKDDARACAMMTPKLRQAITTELRLETEKGNCRTRAADIYSPAKAPGNADATVIKVNVAGKRGAATVTARSTSDLGTGRVESDVFLERHASRWFIANF